MASITKRGGSYLIKVSCGYNCKGKQMVQTITWKPEPGMSAKQIEKEVNRQAVLFEEACNQGYQSVAVKFETFCEEWFESYAKNNLRNTTYERMLRLRPRVYSALGHIRIDKMNPRQIQAFINSLASKGANQRNGNPLSPKTIKHYYSLISEVFTFAEKMDVVSQNPCKKVSIPKGQYKEKEIYSPAEIQKILNLLENEPIKYQVFFTLMIYSGFRRGEMLGLEWKDVNFESSIISIRRTSNYTSMKGTYTDTTKTRRSQRTLKFPEHIMSLLKKYKSEQAEHAFKCGDKWIENDRLFTKWNGEPMYNGQPYSWFEGFCEKNDIPFRGIHCFRHTFASLLVNQGVDIVTVSGALGHSEVSTTSNIYCHMLDEARAKVADAVSAALDFTNKKTEPRGA
ncbi:tyrosine-type recombinase/integrase [uncultured Ruminococcus sp.]|uniref:tyrosine-type recombinase/integrase n=1 Tax=uncultured Ruminococcus sp. TaxID=165186 RepID=UPI0025E4E3D8|nr:tyrosine-type recombinase/integrase [uncultured Ruminococcus sp.]